MTDLPGTLAPPVTQRPKGGPSVGQRPPESAMPHGWAPGERTYPYWDDNLGSLVYAHHGNWIVSVTPMLFNDRVLLTSRDDYPRSWTAGFCYDKGPAAGLAAMAWDPNREPRPVGYKKVAADNRYPAQGEPS